MILSLGLSQMRLELSDQSLALSGSLEFSDVSLELSDMILGLSDMSLEMSEMSTHRPKCTRRTMHTCRVEPGKENVRLSGKVNSSSHGARPVHLIITMGCQVGCQYRHLS